MISGDWTVVVEVIDEMLDDDRYKFATETLTGIRSRISAEQFASLGQRNSIANIKKKKAKRAEVTP